MPLRYALKCPYFSILLKSLPIKLQIMLKDFAYFYSFISQCYILVFMLQSKFKMQCQWNIGVVNAYRCIEAYVIAIVV